MDIFDTYVKTFYMDEDREIIDHTIKFLPIYFLLEYGTDDEWEWEKELYTKDPEGNFVKL